MEVQRYKSIRRWKRRLSDTTFRSYLGIFTSWLEWMKDKGEPLADLSPDELIEYQQNCDNSDSYDILDLIQDYIMELDWRHSSKKSAYSSLRSFFLHNRAPLPDDSSFIIRSDIPPVNGRLQVETIRNLVLSSNKTYQAVFLSMFQGGLDMSGFIYWNQNGYESLKNQLRDNLDIIKIDLPGRKKGRNVKPFFTFIGTDAIDAIRDYLKERPETDWRGSPSKCIFYNKNRKPISKNAIRLYWLRHLDKIGEIDREANEKGKAKRYGKNVHEIRDTFRSQWEKSPARISVAEHCLGHVGDRLGYEKASSDPEWAKREYRKALPLLNIMSSSRPYGKVDEDGIEELRLENQEQAEEIQALKSRVLELRTAKTRRGDVQAMLMREVATLKEQMKDLLEEAEDAEKN